MIYHIHTGWPIDISESPDGFRAYWRDPNPDPKVDRWGSTPACSSPDEALAKARSAIDRHREQDRQRVERERAERLAQQKGARR